ncbi:MAG: hypothetical protein R3324_06870, partial [Halobacteriales archaeon]|nr:hypothetical protein [Halobacteriales archaeon]
MEIDRWIGCEEIYLQVVDGNLQVVDGVSRVCGDTQVRRGSASRIHRERMHLTSSCWIDEPVGRIGGDESSGHDNVLSSIRTPPPLRFGWNGQAEGW